MQLTIGKKMVGIGLLILCGLVIQCAISLTTNRHTQYAFDTVHQRTTQLDLVGSMEKEFFQLGLASMEILVKRDGGTVPADLTEEITMIANALNSKASSLTQLADTPQEQTLAKAINEELGNLLPLTLKDLPELVIQKASAADFAAIDQKIDSQLKHILDQLAKTKEAAKQEMQEASQAMNHELASADVESLGTALAVLIIMVPLFILFARSIIRPLQSTVKMITTMEKGDVNQRLNLTSKDEIGVMARAMDSFADSLQNEVVVVLERLAAGDLTFTIRPRDDQDKLRKTLKKLGIDLNELMSQVRSAAEQIAAGSIQVSDSSQSLSQGATEQASSLEEITSSMAEMASQTQLNAENAGQANQLASQVRGSAEQGTQLMQEMLHSIEGINSAGQNIQKIIKVIDEIAFQTNLLALNAAVEAARAGQHGKGFAVVAEEVRNLAARSSKAANETAELISDSVKQAEGGKEVAQLTAGALQEIVDGVTKMSDLVAEISAASNEQAQGISQINQGLGQIDQVTQTNTANAEESAAAAEELSGQAAHLRDLLARFRLQGQTSTSQKQARASSSTPSLGWGNTAMGNSPTNSRDTFIALDDEEFGRY